MRKILTTDSEGLLVISDRPVGRDDAAPPMLGNEVRAEEDRLQVNSRSVL